MTDEEIEKAKEDLKFFNEGDYITREMQHSAEVLEKYIEQLEQALQEQQEENKKKDKIIDLMAEIFYKRFKAELLLEYGFESEEQLKQCFEREVEDVKN